jgi:predicted lactoylglutathione lyase
MDQRVSMIMSGAQDIATLRKFYEDGLGWTPWMPATPASVSYKAGHTVLVFLDGAYLARERGAALSAGSKSSLAVFVDSKAKVDAQYAAAVAAGAQRTSAVRERDGGLYSGYFADPEGNSWELVWSPHMPLDADGALTLPAPASAAT